jgi:hypothetical protein
MRLKEHGFFSGSDSVERIVAQLDAQFAHLPEGRYWQEETLKLVSRFDELNRPYFRRLRRVLEEGLNARLAHGLSNEQDVDRVIGKLARPEYPLLEKANALYLYEAWFRGEDLKKVALRIENECTKLLEKPKDLSRLRELLNHFKSDLLAQLYRECGQRPIYAGLKTFIKMSAGIPRDLLVILRDTYSWASFNGERPFQEGEISIASQLEAVRHSADWFFEDAVVQSPDSPAVVDSIKRLAELFRSIRFSDKPVECSLATFSVNASDLSEESRRIVRLAENWSYLIRISEGQRDRNSQRVDEKYQLHPMLAPRWDLPISRRGALPISGEFANAIFDRQFSSRFGDLLNARIATMTAPGFAKAKSGSMSLNFDE